MSAGADPRASGRERDGLSTRHSPALTSEQRSRLASHLQTCICIYTVSSHVWHTIGYGHDGCTHAHLPYGTLTHAGGDQSASGVARQLYTTTATPAGSATIPQALRERRLERFYHVIWLTVRPYSRMRATARRHAACANLISLFSARTF